MFWWLSGYPPYPLGATGVSPRFSSLVVARRRKGRPGKACDRGPRSRTRATSRRPTERNTARADDCGDAVDQR